jgi:hypothetical protein
MITPNDFAAKLSELCAIEQRMKHYDTKTPITQVVSDRKRAQMIFSQLTDAILEFKAMNTSPISSTVPDAG